MTTLPPAQPSTNPSTQQGSTQKGSTEKDLVTAALIGTGRRVVPELFWGRHAVESATDSAAATPVTAPSPEADLLDAAAEYDLIRRVGRPLVPAPERTLMAAAPETSSLLPPQVLRAVELLVQPHEFTAEQVAELLGVVVSHADGRRLPVHLVPDLLDRLLVWRVPMPGLVDLLGERGRWLLDARPKWAKLRHQVAVGAAARVEDELPPDWETVWPHLGIDAGQALIRRARAEHPRVAGASVDQHLSTFKAKDRATLLQTLEVGLTVADEPLLAHALGDSAAGVRSVALALLDRIPEGHRGARFAATLRPLLMVHGPLRRKLRVDLPDAPDAQGIADGLPVPTAGTPDRRAWLVRLLQGAPLSVWTDATGRPPAETLAMISDTWVVTELIDVASSRAEAGWADALLGQGAAADALVAVASPARREQYVMTLLTGKTPANRVVKVLDQLPTPWPDTVADRTLDLLGTGLFDHHLRGMRDRFATGLGPALLPKVRRLLDAPEPRQPAGAVAATPDDLAQRRAVLSAVVQFHSFRHSLLEALR